MPTGYVKQLAKDHGITLKNAETKWDRAKELAQKYKKLGDERYYSVVTTIFKNLMGEKSGTKAGNLSD